ncbi:MAG: cell wall-binding repeat-containing protein [Herbiconiux sp.]|nr:cell wall-binding repeat-containing protein [Herbiconiux sp.]
MQSTSALPPRRHRSARVRTGATALGVAVLLAAGCATPAAATETPPSSDAPPQPDATPAPAAPPTAVPTPPGGEPADPDATAAATALVVSRIAGVDRYDGAARVSERMFPSGAERVYVASGENYPDALSAGPAAVRQDAPLLLVQASGVPAATAAELRRLRPSEVILVGGTASVPGPVLTALKKVVPGATVTRIAGPDRYAVSRAVVDQAFPTAIQAYVATGADFPDALSAGAAAGSARGPVVLVDGTAPFVNAPTLDLFRSLRTSTIAIAGGLASVSSGVENSLKRVATVDRSSGPDRYTGSLALNREAFLTSDTIYLATGQGFADALVGDVIAGRDYAPLYLVPGTCVPRGVLDEANRLRATKVVLLGGLGSLSAEVESLKPCP